MNILRSAVLLLLVAGALTGCGRSAKLTSPFGASHSASSLSGGHGGSNPPAPSGGDSLQVEFKGAIESITLPSLVVAGRSVVTDGHTEVRDSTGHIAVAALTVGQNVEVEGTKQADGTVLAREISVRGAQAPAPTANRVEVRGLITEIGADHLTVGATLVLVDAATRFKGFALLSDLKTGQNVEVRALKQADGSLLAQRIELQHAEDDGGEQGDGAGHH